MLREQRSSGGGCGAVELSRCAVEGEVDCDLVRKVVLPVVGRVPAGLGHVGDGIEGAPRRTDRALVELAIVVGRVGVAVLQRGVEVRRVVVVEDGCAHRGERQFRGGGTRQGGGGARVRAEEGGGALLSEWRRAWPRRV